MHQKQLTSKRLRAPKAAAIAGIVFSILMLISLSLLRISVLANDLQPSLWLSRRAGTITAALSLIPFAGVGFLWFVGVLRDRLGEHEDRLFATVFLGSGLLFLGALFSAAGMAAAIIVTFASAPSQSIDANTFALARSFVSSLMNVYAVKMAGVFMLSTSTLAIYTGFVPRYMAFLGQFLALLLLFASNYFDWVFFVFPLWVLMLSVHVLVENFRAPSRSSEVSPE